MEARVKLPFLSFSTSFFLRDYLNIDPKNNILVNFGSQGSHFSGGIVLGRFDFGNSRRDLWDPSKALASQLPGSFGTLDPKVQESGGRT